MQFVASVFRLSLANMCVRYVVMSKVYSKCTAYTDDKNQSINTPANRHIAMSPTHISKRAANADADGQQSEILVCSDGGGGGSIENTIESVTGCDAEIAQTQAESGAHVWFTFRISIFIGQLRANFARILTNAPPSHPPAKHMPHNEMRKSQWT